MTREITKSARRKNVDVSATMISTMIVVIQTSFQVGHVTLRSLLTHLLNEL